MTQAAMTEAGLKFGPATTGYIIEDVVLDRLAEKRLRGLIN